MVALPILCGLGLSAAFQQLAEEGLTTGLYIQMIILAGLGLYGLAYAVGLLWQRDNWMQPIKPVNNTPRVSLM